MTKLIMGIEKFMNDEKFHLSVNRYIIPIVDILFLHFSTNCDEKDDKFEYQEKSD